MNWLTRLFGSSKSVDTVVETASKGLYNGIDMLFHTEEEKAQTVTERMRLFGDFITKAYDQNSIRSVTRRWLAFLVVGPDILCFLLAIVFRIAGIWADIPRPYIETAEFLFEMFKTLVPWAGGALMFYFGPHIVTKLKG